MAFSSRIRRGADGAVHLDLADEERALLGELAADLRLLLQEEPTDPALRRLFPPAHDDETLERGYRELTRDGLVSGRERSLDLLVETAHRTTLSAEEADGWLRALNDARLVLGTRLDVQEDFDWDELDARTPQGQQLALYAYLSWIQEQLVEAM